MVADAYPNAHLLVDAAWLDGHLQDPLVRILDVRPAERYDQGHLENALSVPMALFRATLDGIPGMAIPREPFERLLGSLGIDNDTTVVLYDDSSGLDASRVLWTLEYYGHRDVRLLAVGPGHWQRSGRPLVREVTPVRRTRYQASVRPDRLATLAHVWAALDRPDAVVLDVRTPQEFAGQVVQAARNGHIPGAVNLEWASANLTSDDARTMKSARELRAVYQAVGVTPDKEVIPYCRTAHRASHTYLALRLLDYPTVRLYDGSWMEWGNNPRVPVA
jgi:thiosulfate/3-mercaptopyruvate sulfurtransferase